MDWKDPRGGEPEMGCMHDLGCYKQSHESGEHMKLAQMGWPAEIIYAWGSSQKDKANLFSFTIHKYLHKWNNI